MSTSIQINVKTAFRHHDFRMRQQDLAQKKLRSSGHSNIFKNTLTLKQLGIGMKVVFFGHLGGP